MRRATVLVFAVVLFGCVGGTAPEQLAVGDCFDLPSSTDRIGDVSRRPCDGPHRGEVFHLFEAAPESGTYPTDPEWELIVYPVCDPVFETYTGTPVAERLDIEYRYLVPTTDRWGNGDRRVTCFVSSPEGTPLDRSFRAAP
jgi:hypothetical protein